ncbi:MAG: DUF1707 domain-containing protein [Gemmatimonadetes bacterium]|nr:DUF1707 domain-containing protein [Gemmatimonadota bacterium]MBT8479602.1 DUF1707 domain-containing protein [Gemmatimonadota bacterium]NNK49296.1 DUF1707 and DUF2154 domain-containing protein [Gemmatimonadota bacterium]
MSDDSSRQLVPLKREREHTVKILIDQYAADNLTVDEFESRLDTAYVATTREQLEALLSGLPVVTDSSAQEAAPPIARARADQVKDTGIQIAIMGGSERKGAWTPPRKLYSLAMMGGAGLDFREARMPPGETVVNVLAVMGGVEVIVPPGLAVETHGMGLMGGFEAVDQAGDYVDPDAPRLVIRGMAIMGGVEVTVRLPGETAKDARQRRRIERKTRRRLRSGKGG